MSKLFRAVILGPPGSGKGTISERVARSFGLQHLSSGDFLRENIAAKTEAGVLAKTYIENGALVPDHVMTRLMLPRLEEMTRHSWLLDGFPRTLAQAEALNSACELDVVISLNIPLETLKERLRHRWIHPTSGRVYNMCFNPPRVQGVDDISGEPLIQHEDDKPEALVARLRHYKEVAKPVIDLYRGTEAQYESVQQWFQSVELGWPELFQVMSGLLMKLSGKMFYVLERAKGILHMFSDTDTDRIWPYISSLLSAKIPTDLADSQRATTH